MKKNKKDKLVIYYKDLLNDDFAGTNIKEKKVDGKYKYIHKNLIWRCCSFIFYHIFKKTYSLSVELLFSKTIKIIVFCTYKKCHSFFLDRAFDKVLELCFNRELEREY